MVKAITLLLVLASFSDSAAQNVRWRVRSPGAAGMDSVALAAVYQEAARLPLTTSLLVARNGQLIGQAYWRGLRPGQAVNIKSASKSVLSALVGIAIQQKLIRDENQPLSELLPDYFRNVGDPAKRALTVRQLLTMTAGLESTSFDNYGRWVNSRNWVRYALDRPFVCAPDECMVYSTGNSHILSVILSRRAGASTRAYAQRHLFAPLGMRLAGWARDPQGHDFGGNEMRFTPRDLVKFGELYRNMGRYNGRQIVPEAWIRKSWGEYATSPFNGHRYGYHWWTRESNGLKVHFAWGYGGQFVFVVPARGLVVVATSSLSASRDGRHLRSIHSLVDRVVAATH